MGPTDRVVDLTAWRLEVTGQVKHRLLLSYADLMALPWVERDVLLICPGFFANHGRWRGVSLEVLWRQAGGDPAARRLVIEARGQKSARFSVGEVLAGKLLLAYQVNGEVLPRKHGFPLRLVAEDHQGFDWIKYVDRISIERT
jgi:sulfoxide reductase catalytic subunit YedY